MISKDYLEKYASMLHLLDSEEDFDDLAAEAGYRHEIGRDYRSTRREVLQRYLVELIADFEELAGIACAHAIHSPDLATPVVKARAVLDRCSRYIRLRLFLDRLVPIPRRRLKLSLMRRFMLKVIPRRSTPYEVLARMNTLRTIILSK